MFLRSFFLLFLIKIRFPSNSPISRLILNRYGPSGITSFRNYEKTSKKLAKFKLDLQFLNSCKLYQVFPKFLRFKLYKHSLTQTNLYKSSQYKLLEIEIASKQDAISSLSNSYNNARSTLKNVFSFLDFHALSYFISKNHSKYIQKIKSIHESKLSKLGASNNIHSCNPASRNLTTLLISCL